ITRMNWALPSPAYGCSRFSSRLTGMLDIRPSPFSVAFKTIFINHDAHASASIFFTASHNPAPAIHLHVAVGSADSSRQRDGEIHGRSNRHLRIEMEKHPVRGNVLGFSAAFAGLRLDRDG